MDIKTFREIVRNSKCNYETTEPCVEGLAWLKKETRGCKNTDEFFEKMKKVKSQCRYNNSYLEECTSPHGYLIYIFKYSLDWTEVAEYVHGFTFDSCSASYHLFLNQHFGVSDTAQISIPDLCDALKRAFH